MLAIERSPRARRRRLPAAVAVFLAVATLATSGLLLAARRAADKVARVPGIASALSAGSPSVENFLLVGSDSRANVDPNAPDAGAIGSEGDVTGSRSDTMMVLRRDKTSRSAALLSIPRDLMVTIAGTDKKAKINAAFNSGPDVLVRTIEQDLQIPIHHYVEIDFQGFESLIDALGGVRICFDRPTRDVNSGLNITEQGCPVLDGTMALAYARSRHYETLSDSGQWSEDPTADLGRTKRQRDFVNRALQGAIDQIKIDPFSTGRLVDSISKSLRVDPDLDLLNAATSLRTAVGSGLRTYALPVYGKDVKGLGSVLLLDKGADAVLAFFAGNGAAPPVEPNT